MHYYCGYRNKKRAVDWLKIKLNQGKQVTLFTLKLCKRRGAYRGRNAITRKFEIHVFGPKCKIYCQLSFFLGESIRIHIRMVTNHNRINQNSS